MIVYVPKNIKDNYFWPSATAEYKRDAIKKFIDGTETNWDSFKRLGWRIVKCELTEITE